MYKLVCWEADFKLGFLELWSITSESDSGVGYEKIEQKRRGIKCRIK